MTVDESFALLEELRQRTNASGEVHDRIREAITRLREETKLADRVAGLEARIVELQESTQEA